MPADSAQWLGGQSHTGYNTDSTDTHGVFGGLTEPPLTPRATESRLGMTRSGARLPSPFLSGSATMVT